MAKGGVEIYLDFERYGNEVAAVLAQRVSAEISRRAKRYVRRLTGELRNSIKVIGVNKFTFLVIAETPYAAAQEWGRPDLAKYGFTPYMTPAAEEVSQEAVMRQLLHEAEVGAALKARVRAGKGIR
jgi:hypothetical protein